jgi:hypothetical protein
VIALLAGFGFLAGTTSEAQGPAKPHVVKAPFHVLDKAGKVILAVEENIDGYRGLFVQNRNGRDVVVVAEGKKGNGVVETKDTANVTTTLLGGKGGLAIWKGDIIFSDENEKLRAEFARGGIKVYDKDGVKAVARFGADPEGQFGTVAVGKAGQVYAAMVAGKDSGQVVVRGADEKNIAELGEKGVVVFNKAGTAVGRLGLPPSGKESGYLVVANSGGDAMVEAGVLPEGRGVVRAYPLDGKTPIPIPNFIRGGKE